MSSKRRCASYCRSNYSVSFVAGIMNVQPPDIEDTMSAVQNCTNGFRGCGAGVRVAGAIREGDEFKTEVRRGCAVRRAMSSKRAARFAEWSDEFKTEVRGSPSGAMSSKRAARFAEWSDEFKTGCAVRRMGSAVAEPSSALRAQ